LTVQDIRFCHHFAEHGNAVEAYKKANYHNSNAAYHTVGKAASLLVKKGKIRRYLRQIKEQAADSAGITVDLLAQGFRRVAFADRRGIFGADGSMLPPEFWPPELGSIIAGIEVEDLEEWDDVQKCKVKIGRKWKVRFERSMEARKVLAQWKGMIGADADKPGGEDKKLVIGGDADPDKL